MPGQTKMRHSFPSPKLVLLPKRLEPPSLLDHLLQLEAARLVLMAHRFPSSSSRAWAHRVPILLQPWRRRSTQKVRQRSLERSSGDTSLSSSRRGPVAHDNHIPKEGN
jgi:hypothetical protein